eukprot:5945732-Karenia_brevis.AAC.1
MAATGRLCHIPDDIAAEAFVVWSKPQLPISGVAERDELEETDDVDDLLIYRLSNAAMMDDLF